MVQFCACGGVFVPVKGGHVTCRTCGKIEAVSLRVEPLKKKKEQKDIVVIENNAPSQPTIEKDCSKCGNTKAYYQVLQTRSSDEPPTRFYKCTRCGYTWREYS